MLETLLALALGLLLTILILQIFFLLREKNTGLREELAKQSRQLREEVGGSTKAMGDTLQKNYRVNVAGPTTLAALLNSLQMGFRTLAIQKRSSDVWLVLGAVKAEFGKFGDVIDKMKKKLSEASNVMEDASRRNRAIERKLREVEQLPTDEAQDLPGLDSSS